LVVSSCKGVIIKSVVLIIPPSPFLLDERVFLSLGLLRVAAYLESKKIEVHVLDCSGVKNFTDVVIDFFTKGIINRVNWVGLTATTPQLPSVVKITNVIRQIKPKFRIVLGGPHVTLTYSALKFENKNNLEGRVKKAAQTLENIFDVLVSGDGEYASMELFSNDCPKVIDADEMRSKWFLKNIDYEQLPFPARHLVDLSSYHYQIDGHNSTSLIAQLGCPFHCGFCGGRSSSSLRVIRTRSIQSIVDEIRYLFTKYGYTGFMFYDDELNVNLSLVGMMNSIAELQKQLGIDFRLRGFIKAELFTDEQAEAMVRAGFRWLLCGFEAANPRILTNIEKIATVDDNTRAIEIAKKYGLKIKALMSIGHPGESERSIRDIRDWLIDVEVDDFDCTIITTYPGSPYYDKAQKSKLGENIWTYTQPKTKDQLHAYDLDYTVTADYYKGQPEGGYVSYVFTDYLQSDEIVILRNELEEVVRKKLSIPYNPTGSVIQYEHSMGQGLPKQIYLQDSKIK